VVVPALAATAAFAAGRCGTHPWCDASLSPRARAELVLAQMTTSEKVAMLDGVDFAGAVNSGPRGASPN
jgi:beta-glucosidase